MLHIRSSVSTLRQSPPSQIRRLGLLATALLAVGCSATKASETPSQEVAMMVKRGEYQRAVEVAYQLTKGDPVSAEYELLHQRASMAFFLEQGRRATFADNDRYAITRFKEVLKLDPDSNTGQRWLRKTNIKLATRLTNEGIELAGNNEFEQAFQRFDEAQRIIPGFDLASDAIVALDRQRVHRETLGSEYYDQGVAALVAAEFEVAANRFGYVRKYREEDERLQRRSEQVDRSRSKERALMGMDLEKEQLFYAARASFQSALSYDPNNEVAREGVRRATVESEVSVLMARSESAITRLEFTNATIMLQEALAQTKQQTEEVLAVQEKLMQAQLDAKYQVAVRHENDLRYEKAIASFESLLNDAPGFEDAQERIAGLRTKLKQAGDLYGIMASQADKSVRLGLLMQIEELCPGFQDVPDRMDRLVRMGTKPPIIESEAKVQ